MSEDRDSHIGGASFFAGEVVDEEQWHRDAVDAGLASDGPGQRGRIAFAVGLLAAVSIVATALVAELVDEAPRVASGSVYESAAPALPIDAQASPS